MSKILSMMTIGCLLALAGQAAAESIAYKDWRFGKQTVFVRIEYRSTKSCEYLAAATPGVPAGASVRSYQLPLMVVVAREGPCQSAARRLRLNKTVYIGLQHIDVKLFFVDPNGRAITSESFSISER